MRFVYLARNYSAMSSAYVVLKAADVIWSFRLHKEVGREHYF